MMHELTNQWCLRKSAVGAMLLMIWFICMPARGQATRPPLAATQPAGAHTPFVAVLLRDFDQWDTDHDGVLSVAEIDRAVLDPSVQGDDAAVAGSLKAITRSSNITAPPFTRQYFLDYDRQAIGMVHRISPAAAEAATVDRATNPPPGSTTAPSMVAVPATGPSIIGSNARKLPINWDSWFIAGKRRISRGMGVAFPVKINLDDMRQGPIGDCFLLASVASIVQHRPTDMDQLIKPLPDGLFQVNFPCAAPITVGPLTQSELVISSTTTNEGIWLAALEQGFSKYRQSLRGTHNAEPTDIIARGGRPGDAISMLTAHKTHRIQLGFTIKQRDADQAKLLPVLRSSLTDALKNHRLIVADVDDVRQTVATTGPVVVIQGPTPATMPAPQVAGRRPSTRPVITAAMMPKIPPDISVRHSYAILGYDEKTDMLQIWNPHGQTFTPKGPPGLQNGYVTKHGRFEVPLEEAYRFYSNFVFELSEPATLPAATMPAAR